MYLSHAQCTDSEHPQHAYGDDDDTELEIDSPPVALCHTRDQSLRRCRYDCHVQHSPGTTVVAPMITESPNKSRGPSAGCTEIQNNQLMIVHFSRTEEESSNFHAIELTAKNPVLAQTITLTKPSGNSAQPRGNNLQGARPTKGGLMYHINKWPNTKITNGGNIGRVSGIAVSKSGISAVADYNHHCIHIYNANNNLVMTLGNKGKGNGQFKHPVGVAFDNKNCLYVSEYGNHRVQKFDCNFEYVLQFGDEGDDDGQLNHPMGIAAYKDKVYVADSANSRIAVFYTSGKFCYNIIGGCLRDPYDVAISKTNGTTNGKINGKRLLVADYSACCIQKYTLNGIYVSKFSSFGTGRGQLNHPQSLATDSSGSVFVTDTYNHRISIFDKTGKFVCSFGCNGYGEEQFNRPQGIALSRNGKNLYISDHGNQRVMIFSMKLKQGQKRHY